MPKEGMPKTVLPNEMDKAEQKAWDSLARYKFLMFGYWSGVWVHLNRISGTKCPNPWRDLVHQARRVVQSRQGMTTF